MLWIGLGVGIGQFVDRNVVPWSTKCVDPRRGLTWQTIHYNVQWPFACTKKFHFSFLL